MASARVLTTNELGIIRYQKAAIDNRWPIEVRLLPQGNDAPSTVYSLHTPGNMAIPFIPTKREELRATLAVAPGPLVYEVLRDGLLVSTGGLEVRQPHPVPDFTHYYQQQQLQAQSHAAVAADASHVQSNTRTTSQKTTSTTTTVTTSSSSLSPNAPQATTTSIAPNNSSIETLYHKSVTSIENTTTRSDNHTLSGAYQLPIGQGGACDAKQRWPTIFHYNELPWTVRQVFVIDDSTGAVCTSLSKNSATHGFVGQVYLPPGPFHYRFRVIPNEALHTQIVSQPTCLGWDDGAMTHAWELMTWPLTTHVVDLSVEGATTIDGLMRLQKIPNITLTDISHINDDEDDLDDDDDDEIIISPRTIDLNDGNDMSDDSVPNNLIDTNIEEIQMNLSQTRFQDNPNPKPIANAMSSNDSLIDSLGSASIHTTDPEKIGQQGDKMMDEQEGSKQKDKEPDTRTYTTEKEYPTSSTVASSKAAPAPEPTPTPPTPTVTNNPKTNPKTVAKERRGRLFERGNRARTTLHREEQPKKEQPKRSMTRKSRSGGGLSKLKKKKDKKNGWSGFVVNAAMFILGSTMTIMMGNAGKKKFRDDDTIDSSEEGGRDSIDMDDDMEMEIEEEILTDINNFDARSDEILFMDRRKSHRKSFNNEFTRRGVNDADLDAIAHRRSIDRRNSQAWRD